MDTNNFPFEFSKSFYTFCTYNKRTMVRRKVTLRIDYEEVKRAKKAGMNIDYFLEVKMVEYLSM